MSIHNFSDPGYQVHNAARLGHLASLNLPLANKLVLEVGAGPGDHTKFYLDKRCKVIITDARAECVREALRRHHGKNVEGRVVDMNAPNFAEDAKFEVVHCYGVLYHLNKPDVALEALAKVCMETLVLETCVSREAEGVEEVTEFAETTADYTQSVDGKGCRPSRAWVMAELRRHFPYVYMTRTQPVHAEFPIDWNAPAPGTRRAVFVASRKPQDELFLSPDVLDAQER